MTLKEISEDYRRAAVLVRLQLDEVKEALRTASESDRPALRRKEKELRNILRELRDMRELTAGYYTTSRNRTLSSAGLRADHLNSLR